MTEKNKANLAILAPVLLMVASAFGSQGQSPSSGVGRFGSFKKNLPQTERIKSLLQYSKQAFEKNRTVDEIVGSFAMAQELIHSQEFKFDYPNPEKQQIVEEFANLGMKLSE